jgi:large subunit ribosomal protein L3
VNSGKTGAFNFDYMAFILGKKLKMTQVWKDGKVVPVTVIHAEPNTVSLIRTKEKDGYQAAQIALGANGKKKKTTKREFKTNESMEKGSSIDVSVFTEGDLVRVSGIMKGRGFAGVMKRHNFRGGPATHGQKNRQRHPGSIGSTAFQRVVPGRRMAGRMGGNRVTIKNLVVAQIDKENNLIMLRGAVPGARGGLIEIVKA